MNGWNRAVERMLCIGRGKESTGRLALFQSRTIRRELGVSPETVSRQGCRRPSAPWMALQRVPEALPGP